jgi:DNA excision repair protein ERCC-6
MGSEVAPEKALAPNPTNEATGIDIQKDDSMDFSQLAAGVFHQADLERDIGLKADKLLADQADERDQKRLKKTQLEKERYSNVVVNLEQKLTRPSAPATKAKLRADILSAKEKIATLEVELQQIEARINSRHVDVTTSLDEETGNGRGGGQLPDESRRAFLIRTGKITPFSQMPENEPQDPGDLAAVLGHAEDEALIDAEEEKLREQEVPASHRELRKPGFIDAAPSVTDVDSDEISDRPVKRRKTTQIRPPRQKSASEGSEDNYEPDQDDEELSVAEEPVEVESDDEDFRMDTTPPRKARKGKNKRVMTKRAQKIDEDDDVADEEEVDLAGVDDGNEDVYQARLKSWVERRSAARKAEIKKKQREAANSREAQGDSASEEVQPEAQAEEMDDKKEWNRPHPTIEDASFEGGLKIPGDIFPSLFDYQKTGVKWLWELYGEQVGGIVGDEMGLGKTIQIIAFLAGLHYSGLLDKPVIIVTPATVMKQWVNEFHQWWPPMRVSVLHSSGSGMLNPGAEDEFEEELARQPRGGKKQQFPKYGVAASTIVGRVFKHGHVLITTYAGLQTYAEILLRQNWGYAVLDEGHKIRNPHAQVTIYCKEIRTPNRIILSGTPMQNNLTELWSLYDFVFPMRLGTLVDFRSQFDIPIREGGHANASNLQVETAARCAEALKDAISKYLLQRFKVDVAADLPKMTELVLKCRLTQTQRSAYEEFLASPELAAIFDGRQNPLSGITHLSKICNHPDLLRHETQEKYLEAEKKREKQSGHGENQGGRAWNGREHSMAKDKYGNPTKSGKMQMVKFLLNYWKPEGHKVLLFAQQRIMLDILESFMQSLDYNYRRMDGNTPIKQRQAMVDEYNNDPDIFVFLLTTKVGGLGINLTGADRVIIFDPDWNPSTDMQARERAWRLGQKREVEIFRLVCVGTIEEKKYLRQIYKSHLSTKVLRDPTKRSTLHLGNLHDLFTLGDAADIQTETSELFDDANIKFADKGAWRRTEDGKTVLRPAPASANLPTKPTFGDQDNTKFEAFKQFKGLARIEEYQPDGSLPSSTTTTNLSTPTPSSSTAKPTPPSTKDSRLLSTIFSRTDVHSAVEHDAILASANRGTTKKGKPKIAPDPAILSREARRVAEAAAKELRRNEGIARTVPTGTPTWTGLVGEAGRPQPRPQPQTQMMRTGVGSSSRNQMNMSRGGSGMSTRGRGAVPSSRSVLQNLAQRSAASVTTSPQSNAAQQSSAAPNGTTTAATDPANPTQATQQATDLLAMIRRFLLAHGGMADTQSLATHFQRYTSRSAARNAEFKEMLRIIAVLDRGSRSRMRGRWILREEYGGRG